jgi:hypothetical protein
MTSRHRLPEPSAYGHTRAELRAVFAVVGALAVVAVFLVGPRTETISGTAAPAVPPSTTLRSSPGAGLDANPLLSGGFGLPATTCTLPVFGRRSEALTAYYQAAINCMDVAWGPVIGKLKITFVAPTTVITEDLTASPCGRAPDPSRSVAFYCSADHSIHLPIKQLLADGGGATPSVHLATLAHEYGHHVQWLTGMLDLASERQATAGPNALEMSRRIELQANCFAGVFLASVSGHGSVSKALAQRTVDMFRYAIKAPTAAQNDHGVPTNQGKWATNGFKGGLKACNTWTAPAAEVS